MKIRDMLVFFPAAFFSTATKFAKFNLTEEDKKYLKENHLYHCTKSKDVATTIIKSGYLKPATGINKNINSYGHACVCLFGGIPTPESFMKNLNENIYREPDKITYAIELMVNEKELSNYKSRKINDEAIIYEGYCVLPKDRAKVVEIVADLKRDEKGNVILDEKTGKPVGIEMRKRTLNEINQNPDEYVPKQDFIEFVTEKRKEYGMNTKEDVINQVVAFSNFATQVGNMELDEMKRTTNKNAKSILKSAIDGIGRIFQNKKLDEPINSKIERLMANKNFLKRKNPYDDPKYAKEIVRLRYEGIYQTEFDEGLTDFINSEQGKFLGSRLVPNEEMSIKQNGQMNRIAMMSFMIARDEGLLDGENSERKMEYLLDSVKDTVLKKKAENTKDDERKLLNCVEEADVLDRARLCVKTPFGSKTKIEPKTLKLNGAKKLMEFTYALEYLSSEVGDFRNVLNCREKTNEEISKHDAFVKEIRESLNCQNVQNINLTINNISKTKEPKMGIETERA